MNGHTDSTAYRLSTLALHGDDSYVHGVKEQSVAPAISVTTTFRYPAPTEREVLHEGDTWDPYLAETDIYSRYSRPTTTRVEKVLGQILKGHCLIYPSGLNAVFAILAHLRPTTIAISAGYHGTHGTIKQYARIKGDVRVINLDDDFPPDTLCWVETPVNPYGEERDLVYYAEKVHKAGGKLVVDSTFGPPPLQDPFAFGTDIVMHSATKYLAGHSDCLMGCVAVKTKEEWLELWTQRTYMGSTPGSMEGWLLLRSLRTLEVRVRQQAQTASALVAWLHEIAQHAGDSHDGAPGGVVSKVYHASLQQKKPKQKQMLDGPACFSILTCEPDQAKWLVASCKLFVNATSLGGVESLIEQRFIADGVSDKRLVRLSIGLEHLEDLKEDLRQAFRVASQKAEKQSAHIEQAQ